MLNLVVRFRLAPAWLHQPHQSLSDYSCICWHAAQTVSCCKLQFGPSSLLAAPCSGVATGSVKDHFVHSPEKHSTRTHVATLRSLHSTSHPCRMCAGSIKDYLVDSPEKHGTRTLVEMLRLKRRLNIDIDPTLCALLTSLDIAEALKFMHKSKTLHGDLKPHNILLVSTPQARCWLCVLAFCCCAAQVHRALRIPCRIGKLLGRGRALEVWCLRATWCTMHSCVRVITRRQEQSKQAWPAIHTTTINLSLPMLCSCAPVCRLPALQLPARHSMHSASLPFAHALPLQCTCLRHFCRAVTTRASGPKSVILASRST